jgi:hypothetical protein
MKVARPQLSASLSVDVVGKLQQLLIASDLEKHVLAHDLKNFTKTVNFTASVNENHDQFLSTILT